MAIPKLLELTRHAVQDTGDIITGNLNFSGAYTITNIKAPENDSDAITKNYLTTEIANTKNEIGLEIIGAMEDSY